MSKNIQEEEFNTFGIGKELRRGLVIAIMTLLILAVVYLFVQVQKNTDRVIDMQGKLYEKLLQQQEKTLRDPVNRLNRAADRTDRVVGKVDSVASKTDSVNNLLIKKYRKK